MECTFKDYKSSFNAKQKILLQAESVNVLKKTQDAQNYTQLAPQTKTQHCVYLRAPLLLAELAACN